MSENDFPLPSPVEPIEETDPVPSLPVCRCWRCAKDFTGDVCPFCSAPVFTGKADGSDFQKNSRGLSKGEESPVSVLVFYIVLMAVLWGLAVFAFLCQLISGEELEDNLAFQIGCCALADIAVIVIVTVAWQRLGTKKEFPASRPFVVMVVLFLLLPLCVYGAEAYLDLFPELFRIQELPDCVRENVPALIFFGLSFCVVAPVFEELFFRKIVVDAFATTLSPFAAVFLAAIMFALAHVGAALSYPLLFVLGIYFGLARIYCNSIVVPMLLHGFYNAGVLFLPLVPAW